MVMLTRVGGLRKMTDNHASADSVRSLDCELACDAFGNSTDGTVGGFHPF
jgi:hypothetical protein